MWLLKLYFFQILGHYYAILTLVQNYYFLHSIPIKVEYDKSFKSAYGDNSLFAIRGILAGVQNIYRWSSWKVKLEFQLTSEIRFNPQKSFELRNYMYHQDLLEPSCLKM